MKPSEELLLSASRSFASISWWKWRSGKLTSESSMSAMPSKKTSTSSESEKIVLVTELAEIYGINIALALHMASALLLFGGASCPVDIETRQRVMLRLAEGTCRLTSSAREVFKVRKLPFVEVISDPVADDPGEWGASAVSTRSWSSDGREEGGWI